VCAHESAATSTSTSDFTNTAVIIIQAQHFMPSPEAFVRNLRQVSR
jgi:hypothetical protein